MLSDPTEGLPPFTDDPVDRLVHTLTAYESTIARNPDEWVIRATSSSRTREVTGITWGDLAKIRKLLGR